MLASKVCLDPAAAAARIQELLEANNREVERRREAERKIVKLEIAQRALLEAFANLARLNSALTLIIEGAEEEPDPRQEELDLGNPGLERLMKRQPPWERGEGC
jgi:3-methyladenine DNA glycosylase/8-oxoguanine DNA glycosylase